MVHRIVGVTSLLAAVVGFCLTIFYFTGSSGVPHRTTSGWAYLALGVLFTFNGIYNIRRSRTIQARSSRKDQP
jgi:hypothetical protein